MSFIRNAILVRSLMPMSFFSFELFTVGIFSFFRAMWFLITKHPNHHFLFNVQFSILFWCSYLHCKYFWLHESHTKYLFFPSFLGKYCGLGLQMNHSIESKSNEITVLFMSGIHVSGRGFLASYSVIDKQGNFQLYTTTSTFYNF